jgi:hypothetical protein
VPSALTVSRARPHRHRLFGCAHVRAKTHRALIFLNALSRSRRRTGSPSSMAEETRRARAAADPLGRDLLRELPLPTVQLVAALLERPEEPFALGRREVDRPENLLRYSPPLHTGRAARRRQDGRLSPRGGAPQCRAGRARQDATADRFATVVPHAAGQAHRYREVPSP